MSDLFHALSLASRSLDAQRFGLDITGQNIANVNTPGYSRRSGILSEVEPRGPHDAGGGVEIKGMISARAPLLAARLYRERPSSARESAVADQLAVLETAFGQPGASLDGSMSEFYNAFSTLAADPTSVTARQQVITRGTTLALDFNDMARRFETTASDADREMRGQLDQVNSLASLIATLNDNIGASGGKGADVETLRDRQLAALQDLSAIVDIDVVARDDGGMDVSVGNGRALVVGDNVYALTASTPGPSPYARVVSGTTDITAEITGGRIGGLLHVRDVLMPGYTARLDALASGLANDVNAAHTGGFDLNGAAGQNFFTPPAAVAGAALNLRMNAAVAADPRLVAAAGSPTPGDNTVARAISNLQDVAMTGSSAKPSEAWGDIVFRVGADTKTAQTNRDTHEEVVRQIEQLSEQITGVSLDEEAAMIMRFQRAYEANARFFSAADEALAVLLGMVAR